MTSITTRTGKGSPLTHNEVDANFTNLNTNKLDTAGIALGSAASPTIKFTGDLNTDIYSPGADQLAVSTGGTGRLFVASDGKVGIGTASPAVELHVNGTGFVGLNITSDSTSETQLRFLTNTAARITNQANTALIFDTNALERLRIDSSGRVGIGTTSPGVKLHVADGQIKVANSGAINPAIVFTGNGAGASGFQIGQRYNAQELFIYDTAALADRVVVDSAGNVGIGTSSPTTLLDVNANTVRVRTARTPASATATGATGEICWDANYIYICTATNTWRRTAISSW